MGFSKNLYFVTPANAGVYIINILDSRLRGNDEYLEVS